MRFVEVVIAIFVATSGATAAHARSDGLVRSLPGAEVDWSDGTVTASAGAAADLRMPSPDAARPGAERRAKSAALVRLRAALDDLVVSPGEKLDARAIDNALEHAQIARREYQSNGGVVLWLAVSFGDLAPASKPAPPLVLSVASAPLQLSPHLSAAGRQVRAASATYRPGKPEHDAVRVQCDKKGRLVLPKEALLDSFAGAPVVIYVQRANP